MKVLSTDMQKHFSLVGLLKDRLTMGATLSDDGRDIQMVLNICLHLADISNPARDISIAVPWAKRIQEEFWRQGDLMKEFCPSATIAPMNCRVYASSTPSHESSLQIGFTLGLVKPLFDLVSVGVVVKHDMYVMYVICMLCFSMCTANVESKSVFFSFLFCRYILSTVSI